MNFRAQVHRRFSGGGGRYAYLSNSAAIVRLDDFSERVLEAFDEPRQPDEWLQGEPEAEREDLRQSLQELVGMGMLRPDGEQALPRAELPAMPFPLATLVLNVTNKCNLSCTYCYEFGADAVADAGKRRALMTEETARESVDFLFKSARERPAMTITFFGGETLLNFPVIKATAEYAAQKGRELNKLVHFALTTNATLLTDEVIDLLVSRRFGVTVSIDGDARDQDRHRVFKNGRGSFETIRPRIEALLAKNKQARGRPVGARVTLTRGSSHVREIYDFLHGELGFDEVGFAPVTSAPGHDYALGNGDFGALLQGFGELAEDFVDKALHNEPHGFANLNDLLRELHQGVNKAHPCGAGLGLLGVSTEGKLGLCHRFVESKSHEVGSVQQGIDEAVRTDFLKRGHVQNKIDCQSCFARPVCAGGCYHEAHVRYGDATKANLHYCDWIRSWTDVGLQSYARIMDGNPDFFARFEHQ
jgi:uncharacterized protein